MTDTDIHFYFDPVCPFAWMTSKWVRMVAAQRDYTVNWRFISLRLINSGIDYNSHFPAGYEEGHTSGLRLLRVAARTRAEHGRAAVGSFYKTVSSEIFDAPGAAQLKPTTRGSRAFVEPLLATAGLAAELPSLVRVWSDRHEGVGNVPVPVARGVHQLTEHCGQLGPAGRGELPQDPGQLLLPPVCDLAHQSVTGSGQLQRHHAAVPWLASPGHMACGDHPVSQPGHRGRFESQGPGYLYRAGAAKLRQHGEHPELRERHCPAEHIHAAQRHAGQDPGDRLQGLDAARRQFRLVRSPP